MRIRRKRYWILPNFQRRMIKQWALLVSLAIIITHLITLMFLYYQSSQMPGQYFYIPYKLGDYPAIVDPISVKYLDIALPALLISWVVGLVMCISAGIFYSHRLAGPICRIRRTLQEAHEGKTVDPIVLRKNDEFKELAEDLNRILKDKSLRR